MNKRNLGQYFTKENVFDNPAFKEWAEECDLYNQTVLEPFAGSNNLIDMLGLTKFRSFDIEPKNERVEKRDTIADFPKGYSVCITNPPYLAKNSANRRGLAYPKTGYDDLYKHALSLCLNNCEYVAAIIPMSFLHCDEMKERLYSYVMLNKKVFDDTDHPVCLALFTPKIKFSVSDINLFDNNEFIGTLKNVKKTGTNAIRSERLTVNTIKFNAKNGNLGLIAIDNTKEASIRFCFGDEIDEKMIKSSSRNIIKIDIGIDVTQELINLLNDNLRRYRKVTHDVFLSPFKGLREDGKTRRRIRFSDVKKLFFNVENKYDLSYKFN